MQNNISNFSTLPLIPHTHISKLYGGVLGKIIGVRLGNPIEFVYSSAEMQKKYPYIDGYLDKQRVTYADDDTNGFIFFTKLFDKIHNDDELTPELVANVILNYASEHRGFFWWDKYGTESMVFHNLLNGIPANQSGDFAHIGQAGDYIGGQIFYDAIGLIFAGNPERAASCAKKVARVMHSGEGAYGAQFICACISAAFQEKDVLKIIDIGLQYIPPNSHYAKMIRDILVVYNRHPYDWTACQHFIEEHYSGYMIWQYSTSIIMALLYGRGDFSYSMEICAKSAGDTDCNCGNLGCILGVLNGIDGISYKRWIQPINDILYCSSTMPYENEVSITQFTAHIITLYCKFNDYTCPQYIKDVSNYSHYSFAFPYSYQNMEASLWRNEQHRNDLVNRWHSLWISSNEVKTPSGTPYSLKFWAHKVQANDCLRLYKAFHCGIFDNTKYEPTSCTQLFPGQKIHVNVMTYDNNCQAKVCLFAYSSEAQQEIRSNYITLKNGIWTTLELELPSANFYYDYINVEMIPTQNSVWNNGFDGFAIYLDNLTITGIPNYTITYSEKYLPKISHTEHYPLMQNFTIVYGEAYHHFYYDNDTKIRYDYCRFASNIANPYYRNLNDQWFGNQNKLSMAFTGSPIQDCTIFCFMSVIPKGDSTDGYLMDKQQVVALMAIAVTGAVEHYAVGFYKDKIAILKSGHLPNTYIELCSKQYDYQLQSRYYFEAQCIENQILFTVLEMGNRYKNDIIYDSKCTLSYHAEKTLSGSIGFIGIGNGITIYQYGVMPNKK